MNTTQRYDILKALVPIFDDDTLVICNLGFPAQELFSIQDSERFFYMLGSMGLASSIGLGLSLGTQQKVVVLDGDGSVLMNLGTLTTIANHAPANFILVIIDNSSYGSTGDQPTHTAGVTDLAEVSRGAGISSVFHIKGEEIQDTFQRCYHLSGPHVIVVQAAAGGPKLSPIPLSSLSIRDRFMSRVSLACGQKGESHATRGGAGDWSEDGVAGARDSGHYAIRPDLTAIDAKQESHETPGIKSDR